MFTELHVLYTILQYYIIWVCICFLGKGTFVPLHAMKVYGGAEEWRPLSLP